MTKVIARAITAYMKIFNSGCRNRFLRNHSSTSSPEFMSPETQINCMKNSNLKEAHTFLFVSIQNKNKKLCDDEI
jgi:hypothetical protein